jgi:hypothetical protein
MPTQALYLVHGIFFEPELSLERRARTDGLVVVVNHDTMCSVFSGVIYSDPHTGMLLGHLRDGYGKSKLYDIEIADEEFAFTKKYLDRSDLIRYRFRREGSQWVGGYEGTAVLTGTARCHLIEERPEFFQPPTT